MSAKERYLKQLLIKTTKERGIAGLMLSASSEVLKSITLHQLKQLK